MDRRRIRELQLERLRWTVRHCYRNVPFYRRKLDAMGVDPDRIRTLSDIRYLPITTKEDIRDNYPCGLFAVPRREVVRIHASSGTTGKPTVVGYTKNDLDMWSQVVARLCAAAGAGDEDVAQICFGYGLFTGALGLHYGLERLGATVIPTSTGNTEKQLMMMKDLETTTVISTPSYCLYMAEKAKELGYDVKKDFKLRLGLLGSEGCTPEMRDKIEAAWGLFATDNYGMSELIGPGVSGECRERDGLHIAEDHFLCEVLGPDGEPVPEGEAGELVVTPLTKEAMPLLRYRTKDITRISTAPCRCGRTMARMDKIMGRTDDMLKIRGVNVFPTQIESVILHMKEVGGHYQLIVRREGFFDTLEVAVELVDASLLERYSELERLTQRIQYQLRSVLGIDCLVTLAQPNSLQRFEGKAKRILDLRENS